MALEVEPQHGCPFVEDCVKPVEPVENLARGQLPVRREPEQGLTGEPTEQRGDGHGDV